MEPKNLLILFSDEHQKALAGCYGHDMVRTPHMDELAAKGTRFTNAYTCSPICIPARASFALGKYIHQVGHWDNADPYEGTIPSWHHRLRDKGHRVDSIGKLHFRSTDDDNGFNEEIIPMHVIEGKGDTMGLIRKDLPVRKGAWKVAGMAGPGESSYTRYDRDTTARAQVWLQETAPQHTDKPWVLFVSIASPHFPLTAPPEYFYEYYRNPDLPWPKLYAEDERPNHPYIRDYAEACNYDDHFTSDDMVRRARAGYFGLCTFVDEQIGKIMRTLDGCGLTDQTRVLYTSDHGDNLGARGLWGKSTMYEESAAVPMIITGDDIPEGVVRDAPLTHIDVYPFIMECVGEAGEEMFDEDHLGVSLFDLAIGATLDRTVLSEYHAMGSTTGAFMIRNGKYKFVYYVKYEPQLFDLEADPEELMDLAGDPAFAEVIKECEARLRTVCDPEEVDARAKARQAAQLEANGGREAVIARGDLGFSVPPGVAPDFD
jgi:choline-sulfatase